MTEKLSFILRKVNEELNTYRLNDMMHEVLHSIENLSINLGSDALLPENELKSTVSWIEKELKGYSEDDESLMDTYNLKDYRLTKSLFKDRWGFNMKYHSEHTPDDSILPSKIIEIESAIKHKTNIEIIVNKNATMGDLINGPWWNAVYKISFAPHDLDSTYSLIKNEFLKKLTKLVFLIDKINEETHPEDPHWKIKALIKDDELEDSLILIAKLDSSIENEALLLLSRLSAIRKQVILGTVKNDDYILEYNKIKYAVISLLPKTDNA